MLVKRSITLWGSWFENEFWDTILEGGFGIKKEKEIGKTIRLSKSELFFFTQKCRFVFILHYLTIYKKDSKPVIENLNAQN